MNQPDWLIPRYFLSHSRSLLDTRRKQEFSLLNNP